MKLILLTFLALLSSCSCSSGNDSITRNEETKTQLIDLNGDVLYLVFHHLEWDDLLNLVEAELRFTHIADEVFRHKYQDVDQIWLRFGTHIPFRWTLSSNNELIIYEFETVSKLFRYFGSYFSALDFEYHNVKVVDLEHIAHSINKYCSKSLTRLDIRMQHDLFVQFTTPFEAVEELKIRADFDRFNETRSLSEIFPQLRRLTIWLENYRIDGTVNFSIMIGEYSHLEHFAFSFKGLRNVANNENVRELIRKNPTIRSIDLQLGDTNLVKFISQQLPNVENLTVYDLEDEIVRFENVKNLTFLSHRIDLMDRLSTPRLESLKVRFDQNEFDKIMAFLNNHTQIRNLYMFNMLSGTLEEINADARVANLTNLTDVTFDFSNRYITADPIIRFLENRWKIKRCTLLRSYFTIGNREILRRALGEDWIVDFSNSIGSFERKHPTLE